MARIAINPQLVEGALLLALTDKIQRARAEIGRVCDIMDFTRAGADFAPLAAALGCTAGEAATLYARFRSIQGTMGGADFVNLSDIDQG